MKLYRYMSSVEIAKLFHRETLKNTTDHSKKRGTASTAKGFCFGIGGMEQAKKDFRRLKGLSVLMLCWYSLLKFLKSLHHVKVAI